MLAFWQALLAGDSGTILGLLRDSDSGVVPNAVFDTSDLDAWKNYRSNSRWLSASKASSGTGEWGTRAGLGWSRGERDTLPRNAPGLRRAPGRDGGGRQGELLPSWAGERRLSPLGPR